MLLQLLPLMCLMLDRLGRGSKHIFVGGLTVGEEIYPKNRTLLSMLLAVAPYEPLEKQFETLVT